LGKTRISWGWHASRFMRPRVCRGPRQNQQRHTMFAAGFTQVAGQPQRERIRQRRIATSARNSANNGLVKVSRILMAARYSAGGWLMNNRLTRGTIIGTRAIESADKAARHTRSQRGPRNRQATISGMLSSRKSKYPAFSTMTRITAPAVASPPLGSGPCKVGARPPCRAGAGAGAIAAITQHGEVWTCGATLGLHGPQYRFLQFVEQLCWRLGWKVRWQYDRPRIVREQPWQLRHVAPGGQALKKSAHGPSTLHASQEGVPPAPDLA
jgi:hypothetical protein